MCEFKHIVVDGWNAIHSHPRLKKLMNAGSCDAARAELSLIFAPLHDFGGARVTIVYDGAGEEISIVRRNSIATFSEVFTPSFMTADELIEQLCRVSKNPDMIMVVTKDNLLRLTASSFGALSITPDSAFESSSEASKGLKATTQSLNKASDAQWRKSTPFDAIDPLKLDLELAVRRSALVSKHFKKRAKRSAALASGGRPIDAKLSSKTPADSAGGDALKKPQNTLTNLDQLSRDFFSSSPASANKAQKSVKSSSQKSAAKKRNKS